jgi:hypothetical protein
MVIRCGIMSAPGRDFFYGKIPWFNGDINLGKL